VRLVSNEIVARVAREQRPEWDAQYDPTVPAFRIVHADGTATLKIHCPLCQRLHRHGLGPARSPIGAGDGHRGGHCCPAPEGGYYLYETGFPPPPEMLERRNQFVELTVDPDGVLRRAPRH
jgi:hypothetical protein